MSQMNGKTAFITGGSRGIGKAIALKLAEQGADVAITYAKSASDAEQVIKAVQDLGVKGLALQADASKAENVIEAVDQTVKEFGKIDILINNAGVFALTSITELTLEDFDRFMQVNVRAVFAATMQAVKSMPAGGRIITIGSVNGDLLPYTGGSLYGATKAAVQMMTRGWARDLGEKQITANIIQPGPVDTDMNPGDPAKNPIAGGLTQLTALKRYGEAEEIADLALFLASPQATYITGAAINIDGGLAI